jgi:phthiodiolone/phenolphthiodiolone dimycocerosates ketoreductase
MGIDIGLGVLPTMPLVYADMAVERAEAERLHSVMVPDHLMAWFAESVWPDVGNIATMLPSPHVFFDPVPLIAKWGARTEHVRFVTAVTDPLRRPPAQLAVTALTLSHVTEGRFVLGIGCGEAENCLPYGLPFDRPVSRLEEALTIIRRLWSEGRVSYDGRFWSLRDAVCRLDPYGDRPPDIWVGAHGPRMLELTGRHGDGWLPFMPSTPDLYAERLAVVRRSAEQAGRDPEAIVAALNTPVCVADDHDRAHAMLASEAARQLALALDDDFFAELGMSHPLGIERGTSGYVPEWLSEAELRAALAKIPDPTIAHDHIIHGTPAEVAKQLEAFEDAGLQVFAPLDTSPFADLSQMPGALDRLVELRDHLVTTSSA